MTFSPACLSLSVAQRLVTDWSRFHSLLTPEALASVGALFCCRLPLKLISERKDETCGDWREHGHTGFDIVDTSGFGRATGVIIGGRLTTCGLRLILVEKKGGLPTVWRTPPTTLSVAAISGPIGSIISRGLGNWLCQWTRCAQLSERLRCAECGGQLHSVKPWRMEEVLGKPLGRRG